VDNAIVVVDNIYRKLERGNRPTEAAIFGTQEMFLAIAASTFTTVVVFLPMLFIPGVIGIFFSELAVIVTVTLLGSLFTAVTFTRCYLSMDEGYLQPGEKINPSATLRIDAEWCWRHERIKVVCSVLRYLGKHV